MDNLTGKLNLQTAFSLSACVILFSVGTPRQAQADTDITFQPRAWYVFESRELPECSG